MSEKEIIVDVEAIRQGMKAADDIAGLDGTIIIRKGMEIMTRHMSLLKWAHVTNVRVIVTPLTEKPKSVNISDYPEYTEILKASRVLIVDDSKFLRFKLNQVLTEAGLTVVGQASNGNEAVEAAKEHNPNVITLDVEMPVCDGISALTPLRETVPNALIVMVSSVGEDEKILEALSKGANDFVSKPIDPIETVQSILTAIIIGQSYSG